LIYLIIFFTGLVLTLFFTPSLIDFITRIKVVDLPGERRINKSAIPRMGGLIIYMVVLVLIVSFYGNLDSIRFFILASGLIAMLGIVDDMIKVQWNHKFIIQFLVACFLVYFFSGKFNALYFFSIEIGFPLNYILLILIVVGVINSINMLDGLDGLVSGFSLLITFVTFLAGYNLGDKLLLILSAGLMGALTGFLKFNAYPAKIFLGDTGSYTLGFFLITAALLAGINPDTRNIDLTFAFILLSVPILDTVKVITMRLFSGNHPFLPDRSHIHHLLFEKIPSHKITVFIVESLALLFAALSIYYLFGDKKIALIIYAVVAFPVLFMPYFLKAVRKPFYPEFLKRLRNHLPQIFIDVYLRFVIPVISILTIAILIGVAPLKTNANELVILLSIFFIILLFIYSLVNYQKNKYLNDILVFFNLLLLLFYSSYSKESYTLLKISGFLKVNPLSILMMILIPSVMFFMFFREKMLKVKDPLFSGIDLIILVVIMLLTVSSNLLPLSPFSNANLILFHSFLLYIFYKMFVLLKERYRPPVFYLSFLIPIVVLIRLLVV